MSLTDLIPLVNGLSESDKLSLLKLLAAQIPEAELRTIFSASEYAIFSPYDSVEAADILMQMIKDDQEASIHA